jgi:hypothetical protein
LSARLGRAHLTVHCVRRAHWPIGAELCGAAINECAVRKDDFIAVTRSHTCNEMGAMVPPLTTLLLTHKEPRADQPRKPAN